MTAFLVPGSKPGSYKFRYKIPPDVRPAFSGQTAIYFVLGKNHAAAKARIPGMVEFSASLVVRARGGELIDLDAEKAKFKAAESTTEVERAAAAKVMADVQRLYRRAALYPVDPHGGDIMAVERIIAGEVADAPAIVQQAATAALADAGETFGAAGRLIAVTRQTVDQQMRQVAIDYPDRLSKLATSITTLLAEALKLDPAPIIPGAPGPHNPTVTAMVAIWAQHRKPREKTKGETERAVRLFKELHGDVTVKGITRQHVRDYRRALEAMPIAMKNEIRALPLPEMLNRVEAEMPDTEKRGPTSVGKDMRLISALYELAASLFDDFQPNPFTGILPDESVRKFDREGFEPDELKRVYDSVVLLTGAKKWVPLIAILGGARLEEIGQLSKRDIKSEEGVPYINMTTIGGGKLKNDNSKRRVPVHPRLIELGFLEYVIKQTTDLFPELPPTGGDDKRTDGFSKWFGRHLDGLKITERGKDFHALRHNFKSACRAGKITKEQHQRLTGHGPEDVGDEYGLGFPIDVLYDAICKIRYPILGIGV